MDEITSTFDWMWNISIETEWSLNWHFRVVIFEDLARLSEVVDPRLVVDSSNYCCCPRAICERCFWPIFHLNIHFAQLFRSLSSDEAHRWEFIAAQGCEKCKEWETIRAAEQTIDVKRLSLLIMSHLLLGTEVIRRRVSQLLDIAENKRLFFPTFSRAISENFESVLHLKFYFRAYTRDDGRWFRLCRSREQVYWTFNLHLRVLSLQK